MFHPSVRFCLLFVLWIAIFTGLSLSSLGQGQLHRPLCRLLAEAVRVMLSPFGGASMDGTVVRWHGFGLEIIDACDGVLPISIYVAALLAFPGTWLAKVTGFLIGVPTLFAFNLVRLTTLVIFGASRPDLFEWVHIYVGEALIIVISLGLWIFWAERLARSRSSTVLRFFLLFAVFYAAAFVMWLPLRAAYMHLLSWPTESLVRAMDRPSLITSLSSRGDSLVISSIVGGRDEPVAAWNASNLHIFILASLALVLAAPQAGTRRRFLRAGLTIVAVTGIAVLICFVQVESTTGAWAAGELGLEIFTAGERSLFDSANRLLIGVGILLFPALFFLVFYRPSWWEPERVGRPPRSSRRAKAMAVGFGLMAIVISAECWVRASTSGPTREDHLMALAKVKRLNPASARPACSLGVFYEEQGELEKAAASYREALALDSDMSLALFGLGNVLVKRGAYDEAVAEYRLAVRADPAHVDARENLGIALILQGRYPDAVDQLREVIRLDPRQGRAHYNLWLALSKLNRPCEGLSSLRLSTTLDRAFAADSALQAEIAKLQGTCPSRVPDPVGPTR